MKSLKRLVPILLGTTLLLSPVSKAHSEPYYSQQEEIQTLADENNISPNLTVPIQKRKIDSNGNGIFDENDKDYNKIESLVEHARNPAEAFLFLSAYYSMGADDATLNTLAQNFAKYQNSYMALKKTFLEYNPNKKNGAATIIRISNVASSLEDRINNSQHRYTVNEQKESEEQKFDYDGYAKKAGITNALFMVAKNEITSPRNIDIAEKTIESLGGSIDQWLSNLITGKEKIKKIYEKADSANVTKDKDDDPAHSQEFQEQIYNRAMEYLNSLKIGGIFKSFNKDSKVIDIDALRISRITSEYEPNPSWRHIKGNGIDRWIYEPHPGIDYVTPDGKCYSGGNGKVARIYRGGGGTCVVVDASYDGHSVLLFYTHTTPLVKQGDEVKLGQKIGYQNAEGLASGNHTDLRAFVDGKPVDPRSLNN
jgi:murein DD-endopeptidase MepM/ murein hydrolase activator NlpD